MTVLEGRGGGKPRYGGVGGRGGREGAKGAVVEEARGRETLMVGDAARGGRRCRHRSAVVAKARLDDPGGPRLDRDWFR